MSDNRKKLDIINFEKKVEAFVKRGMSRQKAERMVIEQDERIKFMLKSISITDGKYDPAEGIAYMAAGMAVGTASVGYKKFEEELDGYRREDSENKMRQLRKTAREKSSKWIKEGKKLVFPERHDDWEARIGKCVEGPLCGFDVVSAIEIMRMLEKGIPVEEVIKEKTPEGTEAIELIRDFSKRGPEYIRGFASYLGMELSPEVEANLKEIESANLEYARTELERNKEKKFSLEAIKKFIRARTTDKDKDKGQGQVQE